LKPLFYNETRFGNCQCGWTVLDNVGHSTPQFVGITAMYGILRRNFHLQIFVCLSKQSYDLLQGANDVTLFVEQENTGIE